MAVEGCPRPAVLLLVYAGLHDEDCGVDLLREAMRAALEEGQR
jgi:hypothetical protein